jgi:hypothetical protein
LDGFHTDITNVKDELKSMRLDVLGLMDVAVEQFDHLNQVVAALGHHRG